MPASGHSLQVCLHFFLILNLVNYYCIHVHCLLTSPLFLTLLFVSSFVMLFNTKKLVGRWDDNVRDVLSFTGVLLVHDCVHPVTTGGQ